MQTAKTEIIDPPIFRLFLQADEKFLNSNDPTTFFKVFYRFLLTRRHSLRYSSEISIGLYFKLISSKILNRPVIGWDCFRPIRLIECSDIF